MYCKRIKKIVFGTLLIIVMAHAQIGVQQQEDSYAITASPFMITHAGLLSDIGDAIKKVVRDVSDSIRKTFSGSSRDSRSNSGTLTAGQTGKLILDGISVYINETGKTYAVVSTRDEAVQIGKTLRDNTQYDSYKVYQLRDSNTGEIVGYTSVARNSPKRDVSKTKRRTSVNKPGTNLVLDDIVFLLKSDSSKIADQTNLIPNNTYIPTLLVSNNGCLPTNYPGGNIPASSVTVPSNSTSTKSNDSRGTRIKKCKQKNPVFIDSTPFGSGGSFPLRLRIDFDNNGVYEYNEYQNNIGPLAGYGTETVTFPDVQIPEGNHKVEAVVDLEDAVDPGYGCIGTEGCIIEKGVPVSNSLVERINAYTPQVQLGSYLLTQQLLATEVPSDIRYGNRDIVNDDNVGLYWSGQGVDFSSCTGTTVTSEGDTLSDFSGQKESSNLLVEKEIKSQNYDVQITEPKEGEYHVYTISCSTTANPDTKVTSSIIINNGTSIQNIIPDATDFIVQTGERVTSIPFGIRNVSQQDISQYTYRFIINGIPQKPEVVVQNVPQNAYKQQQGQVSWVAPDMPQTLPFSVCVMNATMPGEQCSSASIIIIESQKTECSDIIDNDGDGFVDMNDPDCTSPSDESELGEPSISASPSLVRKGDPVTITWSNVGSGCGLSGKLASEDATVPGSATFIADKEVTVTLTCGSLSDSVTIQVLPIIYEI